MARAMVQEGGLGKAAGASAVPGIVYVLNGPNLNLLGKRQPQIYGHETLADVEGGLAALAGELGLELRFLQSNWEGQIVDWIHEAMHDFDGILLNPAAYTHTSIAIRDALAGSGLPAVEVHLSNLHAREDFRRESITAPACIGTVTGFGPPSYALGLRALIDYLKSPEHETTHTT